MKKLLAMVMCVCLAAMFTACGKSKDQTDSEYVKEKGKLVIGITDYAPMDYEKTKGKEEEKDREEQLYHFLQERNW